MFVGFKRNGIVYSNFIVKLCKKNIYWVNTVSYIFYSCLTHDLVHAVQIFENQYEKYWRTIFLICFQQYIPKFALIYYKKVKPSQPRYIERVSIATKLYCQWHRTITSPHLKNNSHQVYYFLKCLSPSASWGSTKGPLETPSDLLN